MQRERRHNPYPWTWEIPVGIASAVLLVLAVGVHLGNSLAHLTTGRGWTWPPASKRFASLPAVIGNPADGVGVHTWIVTVELLLLSGLSWIAVWAWQRFGPSRLKGVATREQAEQVLGRTRLHKVAGIVRPDLHPTRRPRGAHR